jgi:hypothetical protein
MFSEEALPPWFNELQLRALKDKSYHLHMKGLHPNAFRILVIGLVETGDGTQGFLDSVDNDPKVAERHHRYSACCEKLGSVGQAGLIIDESIIARCRPEPLEMIPGSFQFCAPSPFEDRRSLRAPGGSVKRIVRGLDRAGTCEEKEK